mgnify:CR=1 FL=1
MARRATKIVVTLGPASSDPAILETMIRAGVNVVRLNFSHGTAQDHIDRAALVRRCSQSAGREVAIMADLQGPKIRVGKFADGKVHLESGTKFVLDASRAEPGDHPGGEPVQAGGVRVRGGDGDYALLGHREHRGRLHQRLEGDSMLAGFGHVGEIDAVRACYQAGLDKDPDLRGKVEVRFTIGLDGPTTLEIVDATGLTVARLVEETDLSVFQQYADYLLLRRRESLIARRPLVLCGRKARDRRRQ